MGPGRAGLDLGASPHAFGAPVRVAAPRQNPPGFRSFPDVPGFATLVWGLRPLGRDVSETQPRATACLRQRGSVGGSSFAESKTTAGSHAPGASRRRRADGAGHDGRRAKRTARPPSGARPRLRHFTGAVSACVSDDRGRPASASGASNRGAHRTVEPADTLGTDDYFEFETSMAIPSGRRSHRW